MSKLDPFSKQIVELVRNMPDEAILALVQNQLSSVVGVVGNSWPEMAVSARPKTAVRKRRPSKERMALLTKVEKVVRNSKGLSASEVARKSRVSQARASSALRELKTDGRVFQGGDRRFARYASDQKQADLASDKSRRQAKGPLRARR